MLAVLFIVLNIGYETAVSLTGRITCFILKPVHNQEEIYEVTEVV